jgi:hypothetical protein
MKWLPLLLGDFLALALVTLIGFATHGENGLALLPRLLASLGPLALGWSCIAPLCGLFNPEVISNPRQAWRPVVAMLAAGPLAVLLRAQLLQTPVIPSFVIVLSGTSGLGLALWRALWRIAQARKTPRP